MTQSVLEAIVHVEDIVSVEQIHIERTVSLVVAHNDVDGIEEVPDASTPESFQCRAASSASGIVEVSIRHVEHRRGAPGATLQRCDDVSVCEPLSRL